MGHPIVRNEGLTAKAPAGGWGFLISTFIVAAWSSKPAKYLLAEVAWNDRDTAFGRSILLDKLWGAALFMIGVVSPIEALSPLPCGSIAGKRKARRDDRVEARRRRRGITAGWRDRDGGCGGAAGVAGGGSCRGQGSEPESGWGLEDGRDGGAAIAGSAARLSGVRIEFWIAGRIAGGGGDDGGGDGAAELSRAERCGVKPRAALAQLRDIDQYRKAFQDEARRDSD